MFALLAKNNREITIYFSPSFGGNIGEWNSLIFLSNQKDGHSLRGQHAEQTVVRLNTLARQIKDHHSCVTKSNIASHDHKIMRSVMTGCRCIDGSYFYCFCRKGHPGYEKFLCFLSNCSSYCYFPELSLGNVSHCLLFIAPQVLIKSDN